MHLQISYSPEPKIIGVNNGVYQLEVNFEGIRSKSIISQIESTLLRSNAADFLLNQHKVKNIDFKGIKGIPLKKAKITDIMVFSPFMFGIEYIVSEKFVNCLNDLSVSKEEYNLFPIELEGIDENYYLFFIPWIPTNEVDFSKSLLYLDQRGLEEKSYLEVNSYEAYCKLNTTNPFNSFEKITLPAEFKEKDILNVQGAVRIFLSKSLLKKLEDNNITNLLVPKRQISLEFGD